jgi:hypothetical protein
VDGHGYSTEKNNSSWFYRFATNREGQFGTHWKVVQNGNQKRQRETAIEAAEENGAGSGKQEEIIPLGSIATRCDLKSLPFPDHTFKKWS